MRPLRLQIWPLGPVEERRLQLAPAAFEADPREVRLRRGRPARDRPHDRPHVEARSARVVAADALLRRAAEVKGVAEEVRMRTVGRVHDGMGAADELELVVAPRRPFRALVLAVADLERLPPERLLGR